MTKPRVIGAVLNYLAVIGFFFLFSSDVFYRYVEKLLSSPERSNSLNARTIFWQGKIRHRRFFQFITSQARLAGRLGKKKSIIKASDRLLNIIIGEKTLYRQT